ncbi:MAG: substrate-binding domain-containing protein [Oscillospiraceae bacterium]
MKKLYKLIALLGALLLLAGCAAPQEPTPPAVSPTVTAEVTPAPAPENPVIRLSTTTSVNDSGLLSYLQPFFEEATGYKLEITSNGTGAAIKLGESGDADCLLVHAKASEEEFVAGGNGVERIPFMYNYFVLTGPESDPAGLAQCADATAGMKAIAAAKAPFVSRGDDSGTHKAELKLWKSAEVDPAGKDWYLSAGAGMGACLTQASERQAYVLTDKATYLSMADNLELKILLEKSDEMKNTYSVIAVSPEKHEGINAEGASAFIDWITGPEAGAMIADYGIAQYGEALFYLLEK